MKRIFILIVLTAALSSCGNQSGQMQTQIDSLQKKTADVYKPGFGEFMTYVQIHHAKLWFAGENQNWELANFEINEIKETVQNIEKFEKDRAESKIINMIYPYIDSVSFAITQKNSDMFVKTYESLTANCNNCHALVNYGFNKVKKPDTPPFTNQTFK
ncbi:MAG TPA: lipoprotein [Ignavibacteria bacterium]|nr:lipoprotein [Ignavibacteria bacterium]